MPMPTRHTNAVDVELVRRCAALPIGTLTLTGALIAMLVRRRRRTKSDLAPDISQIVDRCESVSAQAFGAVLDSGTDSGLNGWQQLHASTMALDRDITSAADSARDTASQRSLDELAAAAIALRGALEVRARAGQEASQSPAIIAASNDLVIVRSEDLVMSARAVTSHTS